MYPLTTSTSPITPVALSERIGAIDVLRGFAVLGILIVNIQGFSMIDAAYFNPRAYGDLTGVNYAVWLLTSLLADQKFMTLFSLLFGAGVLIMTGRQEATGRRSRSIHFRRMGFLLLFGLLHAYLFWHGDILVYYAFCGMTVYAFRHRSPRFLMIAGLMTIAVASALSLLTAWSMQFWSPQDVAEFVAEFDPPPEKVAEQLAAFQGGWAEQLVHRAPLSLEFHTLVFLFWGFWRASGLMLIGMALLKLDVITGKRSARFYRVLVALALLVGLPVVALGIYRNIQAGWDARVAFFINGQFNYWGSLVVSAGWMGLVMLAVKTPSLGVVTRPLAAVGRMALSNYLGQTIICTTLFYGHGFGLYGRVERGGQIVIVLAVWAVQLIISPIWLRYFQFGPLEWLWRSLTYRSLQPMRKR